MKLRTLLAFASLATLAHAGCATIERDQVTQDEDLLAEAGFHTIPANSPERVAILASLPAHRLASYRKNDRSVYVYADADYCRCVYIGGRPEYAQYELLAFAQHGDGTEEPVAMDSELWSRWSSTEPTAVRTKSN